MKCGSIEGNDGVGCVYVRAIVNQNQSINGADAVSDNDSYDDISVMPVNEVFVGCLESVEYFNTTKLGELKKKEGSNASIMALVSDASVLLTTLLNV